jgi:hypothetical protein
VGCKSSSLSSSGGHGKVSDFTGAWVGTETVSYTCDDGEAATETEPWSGTLTPFGAGISFENEEQCSFSEARGW